MLKTLLSLSICVLLQFSILAQFSVGASLALGSKVDGISFQVRGGYDFDAPIRVSVDILRSFGESKIFYSEHLTEFNANAHYKVIDATSHSIYSIAGFNLTKPSFSTNLGSRSFSTSDSIVGWNLGAGSQYEVAEQIAVIGEIKYIVGDAHQWVLALGGVYLF